MEQSSSSRFTIGLILAGAFARLLPHPPNVAPIAAMALLGGAMLPRPQAFLAPLAALFLSDLFIGLHSGMPFVYGAFAMVVLLGGLLREERGVSRLAAVTLAGSVLFFAVTNLGVWLSSGMYPANLGGLQACYAAALPFFRNSLLGDAFFTAALFGLDRLARTAARAPVAA